MHDGLKIMIGASATALLAWAVHGPLGQGKAFVSGHETDVQRRLALQGLKDVEVHFPTSPYSRMAHLTGAASLVDQDDAVKLVGELRGTSGAVWGEVAKADHSSALAAEQANAASVTEPTFDEQRSRELAAVIDSMAAPLPGESPKPAASPAPIQPSPNPAPTVIATPAPPLATPRPTPASTPAARPAPPARPAANLCQRAIDAALAGRVMSFQSGSAWLNPQSNKMIAEVAAALKKCSAYAIEIGGHTDSAGDEGVNRSISQERADRVRAGLIAKGVPSKAVVAKGYGSTRPIRAGDTLNAANRRITFTVSRGGA